MSRFDSNTVKALQRARTEPRRSPAALERLLEALEERLKANGHVGDVLAITPSRHWVPLSELVREHLAQRREDHQAGAVLAEQALQAIAPGLVHSGRGRPRDPWAPTLARLATMADMEGAAFSPEDEAMILGLERAPYGTRKAPSVEPPEAATGFILERPWRSTAAVAGNSQGTGEIKKAKEAASKRRKRRGPRLERRLPDRQRDESVPQIDFGRLKSGGRGHGDKNAQDTEERFRATAAAAGIPWDEYVRELAKCRPSAVVTPKAAPKTVGRSR